jgi:hypothetical protein
MIISSTTSVQIMEKDVAESESESESADEVLAEALR